MPMRKDDCLTIENKLVDHSYKPQGIVLSRGEGVWVWDTDSNKYLDCLSVNSSVSQGHCHPKIRDTLIEQIGKLSFTSSSFYSDKFAQFYEEICALTNSHEILPLNNGVEAIESAIKFVRRWGYQTKRIPENKTEIITCNKTYHGCYHTILGFSTNPVSRKIVSACAPGFKVIPFGDADALEAAIKLNTTAFLVEPIQNDTGVIIPPEGYLQSIRDICSRNNVILVLNEIQTGLGRTGKMLAEEHEKIEADLTLVGNALSGGFYPISAILSNSKVLDTLKPDRYSSTFGDNPLACAVARTSLRVLIEEGMFENAAKQGSYFIEQLQGIHPNLIKEIRGRGLMVAIEFHPEAESARTYCKALKKTGLLAEETHDHIIRFTPH